MNDIKIEGQRVKYQGRCLAYGDVFDGRHGRCLLAQTATKLFSLIGLSDGNRWSDPAVPIDQMREQLKQVHAKFVRRAK